MTKPSWPKEVAHRHGAHLRKLRETIEPTLHQKELADRLEMAQSWVSRVEKGEIALRSEADVRTYASALGAEPDAEVRRWLALHDENFGVWPWREKAVLPESFRREGEERARDRKFVLESKKIELGFEVPLEGLRDLVRTDETARAVIAAMWDVHIRSQASR